MITLTSAQKSQYEQILEQTARSIDLTPAQYQEATRKYEAVGEFLCREGHELARYSPKITCQGSIRNGTAVRPVIEDDEFDVDLTCHLNVALPEAQAAVKKLVGDRFKADGTYRSMLEEMRRCWRLHYAESSKFHLDVVPAILLRPDKLLAEGVTNELARHLIAITDNKRSDYWQVTSNWQQSNPEGYALWFLEATKTDAAAIRNKLVEARLYADVAQIPSYEVRTPLQRAVQLMKRHRDVMFNGDENKPISVILTTLAATAYTRSVRSYFPFGSPASFYDLLLATVDAMPRYIESRNGIDWVANPVNPTENFADKWVENPMKKTNFFKWHSVFRTTIASPDFRDGLTGLAENLKGAFGNRAVSEAFQKIGSSTTLQRDIGLLKVSSAGIISSTTTTGSSVPKHTFHGKV